MPITAAGVGSGLDIEGIITSLMNVERLPLNDLKRRETDYKAELSAYGQVKSAVSTFQDAMKELGSADKFKIFTSTSSDEDVATVSTDSKAANGLYTVDVQRLAQNHKQGSDEFASTQTFNGDLTIGIGDDSFTVDVSNGGAGSTLAEIRDAINQSADNSGVTATILHTSDNNERLVITSDESGYDKRLDITGSIAGGLNLQTVNQDKDGNVLADLTELDSAFTIDGFALTRGDNEIDDAFDGITFSLKSVGNSTINVNRDTEAIQESAKGFVDAFNALQNTVRDLGQGELSGDSTLRTLQRRMRDVLNTAPAGLSTDLSHLSQLGIATQRDGTLQFNSRDFEKVLDADFAGVAELFSHDDQGFAFQFSAVADRFLDNNGLIDSREDGLNRRIRSIEDKQTNFERNLELKEKSLRSQYATLDSLIGSLQTTGQFLSQQLVRF
ncbi:MAG: flagellar filament capping protein FliD [Methylococcales bacterium]